MSDELDKKFNEIINHLDENGFNIFYSKTSLEDTNFPEFEWDLKKDWKGFFSIAKSEGVKTVMTQTEKLTEEDFEEFKDAMDNSTISPEILQKFKPILIEYKKNMNKLGAFTFHWIKNETVYTLSEKTEWFSNFEQELTSLAKEERDADHSISRSSLEEEELPEEIRNKSAEELSNEFFEYLLKEFPHPDRRDIYTAEELFWQQKGLERYSSKGRLLRTQVSSIVSRKIDKREKEMIPQLVEDCIKWAKENELSKMTKTNVIGFLAEKEIELSSNNKNILHTKVSLKLKLK